MAGPEGRNNGTDVPGIKLFGTTITLENSRQQVIKEEQNKIKGDHRDHDPTVEMKRPEKIIPCPSNE